MLFLLMAAGDRKILCLTEEDMPQVCHKEVEADAKIPADLDARLKATREVASKEVRP